MPLMLLFWAGIVSGLSGSRVEVSTVGGKSAGRRRQRSSNGDSPKARYQPRSTRSAGRSSRTHRDKSVATAHESRRHSGAGAFACELARGERVTSS
jgi:hypothetical protein